MMTKFKSAFEEFRDSCSRLDEVLRIEKTEIIRDSAIKRFELAFDTSWKAIKASLEEYGATCTSPLDCYKEAYRQKYIDFEDVWVELVKTRNKTVHTYDRKLAEEVYQKLPEALEAFKKLLKALESKKI